MAPAKRIAKIEVNAILTGAARRVSILLTMRTPSFGSADRAAGERMQIPLNFVKPLLHMHVYWLPKRLRHVFMGPPHIPASFILQYWTLQSDPRVPLNMSKILYCTFLRVYRKESLVHTLQNWPFALLLQANESGVLLLLEHNDQEVQASVNISNTGLLLNAESMLQEPLTMLSASLLQQYSNLQPLKSCMDVSAPWTLVSLVAR